MNAVSKSDLIKAKILAEISEDVYRPISKANDNWERLNSESVKKLGIDVEGFKDVLQQPARKHVGLTTAFYKTKNGELVTAFAGTNIKSPKEWITNFRQGLGFKTKDYSQAVRLAIELKQVPDPKIMTGHSKGGALACLAASITNSKAITFNTAGLHKNTLNNAGMDYDAFKLNKANELIVNYANNGEVLQKVNGLQSAPNPLGPKFEIGEEVLKGKGSFSRHGIGLVVKSLNEAIQKESRLEENLSSQNINQVMPLNVSSQLKDTILNDSQTSPKAFPSLKAGQSLSADQQNEVNAYLNDAKVRLDAMGQTGEREAASAAFRKIKDTVLPLLSAEQQKHWEPDVKSRSISDFVNSEKPPTISKIRDECYGR